METLIKFGTSGFRGVIADTFTFKTLIATIHAIADYVHAHPVNTPPKIMVGYDPRFMGDVFAAKVAEVLNTLGIDVLLTDRDTPTPVIAFYVIEHRLDGAINITASHNPPLYTGIKFTPSWGGPALLEETKQIEARANHYLESSLFRQKTAQRGTTDTIDPLPEYIGALEERVDFKAITKANLKVAIDPMHGAGRGYLASLCDRKRITYTSIHQDKDPYFGGRVPDPEGANLGELKKIMEDDTTIALGMATDGDADRFGIVDRGGRPVLPGYVLAVLSEYLLTARAFKGGIARSIATTHLIDRIARQHGREVYETPVGFKHIGKLLSQGKVFFGGEESGGLSITGHVPEKDGIIAGLLVLEAVAATNKSVSFLLEDVYKMVGTLYHERLDLQLDDGMLIRAKELITTPSMLITMFKPLSIDRTDGLRLLLEGGSWIMLRLSGTEPALRIYAEGRQQTETERYLSMVRSALGHA